MMQETVNSRLLKKSDAITAWIKELRVESPHVSVNISATDWGSAYEIYTDREGRLRGARERDELFPHRITG